jgi:hypothetical protein
MIMDDGMRTNAPDPKGPQQPLDNRQTAGTMVAGLAELREQRTLEYLQTALKMEDPLSANVGAMSADLMLIAGRMGRVIGPALEKLPAQPGALANLLSALESYGRVARQIERLTLLLERIERQEQVAKKAAADLATNTGKKHGGSERAE